jgi:hypothetical protein
MLSADGFALKIISDSKSGSPGIICKLFLLECNPFFMENLIFITFRLSLTLIILAEANLSPDLRPRGEPQATGGLPRQAA